MDNNQSNYNVTAGSSSSLVDGGRVQVPVQKTPSEAGAALGLDTPSSGLHRRQYVDDYRHSVHSNPLLFAG
jgi:hypothetical protein